MAGSNNSYLQRLLALASGYVQKSGEPGPSDNECLRILAEAGENAGPITLAQISDMSADARTRNTKTDAELQSQLAILPQVTGASTWVEFQPGKPVVYAGSGSALYIANSEKIGLTIINIGVSTFDLWDVSNTNFVTVSPGEAVLFDTVDEGEGVFSFTEIYRTHLLPTASTSAAGKVQLATAISDNSSTVVTSALAKAALDAKANMREIKTSNFTAAVNGRYTTDGTVSVTDPSGTAAGQIYSVLCGSGTATIGGTAYSPSRLEIVRYYNGSAWSTLTTTLSDNLTLNGTANTAPNQTAASGSSVMTRDLSDARSIFSIPFMQTSDNQAIANGAAKLLGPYKIYAFSSGLGTHIPSAFTKFRVLVYFGWASTPGADTFPVYTRFENKAGSPNNMTYESLHGTRYGVTLYPDTAGGLPGTLTNLGATTYGRHYKFVSDWITIPAGWASNAATNGWYEVLGIAVGNGSGGSLADDYNGNHTFLAHMEFLR